MSGIKGGAIVTTANGQTVIDRIQTGGPGQVNIPTEKINELGNFKSVATVRDTPDLQFSYESYDVSTETEALVTGQYGGRRVADAATTGASTTLTSATGAFTSDDVGRQVVVAGAGAGGADLVTTIASVTDAQTVELDDAADSTQAGASLRVTTNGFDLALSRPIDIASQFKAGRDAADAFKVVASVAVPFLHLTQMQYNFGLNDNATQQGTFQGDSIFYNPGATFIETTQGDGSVNQAIVTQHPAFLTTDGGNRRVLSVTDGSKRLTLGADYTETYGAVVGGAAVTTVKLRNATTDNVRIVYASPDALAYPQSVHEGVSVKPAAVKGRDIEIYLGGYNPNDVAGSQVNRLGGIQAAQVGWQVQMEADEEFGNYYAIAQDFEVPTVNGSLDFKPRDPADLLVRLRQAANITDDKRVIGPSTSQPLPLDVVIKHPETGSPLKRFHVPDARFTIPGFQGRVLQKTTFSLPWESDEGELLIFER